MRHRHRPGWIHPLRRMQRATEACLRWINCSCAVIDEAILIVARRPVFTTMRLLRACQWLDRATDQLERAGCRLRDTQRSLARAPEEGGAVPQIVCEAAQQWSAAASRLLATHDQLALLLSEVLQWAMEGGFDIRPVIAASRPAAPRWYLRYCRVQPSNRIRLLLQRRRRPARTASADAPRRVSRGRAPPFVLACPL
ncbi:MAG TPA: hypothetical protein VI670_10610 [Thermoanaerobaculia bacterium]